MEGPRFLIAIVLSIAVVILVNIMFPPAPPAGRVGPDTVQVDTVVVDTPLSAAPGGDTVEGVGPEGRPGVPDAPLAGAPAPEGSAADTVWVRTGLARYGFSTRGAALVSVELLRFESYTHPGPVQLVEPGDSAILAFGLRADGRVLPLDEVGFRASVPAGDTLFVQGEGEVTFETRVNGTAVRLSYRFEEDQYLLGVDGEVTGLPDATLLVDIGPRLAVNEADSAEDLRALSYVVNARRTGIESVRITNLEENRIEEGPLGWVAIKNKYFLAAALEPGGANAAFGGLLAEGGARGATGLQATLPVTPEGAFDFRLFFGPQEYGRLAALGEGLKDVNPYGWRIFRPIIRPLADIITWILTGLHNVLGFGYGWVLILFGFAMRIILWPLNAKAMRSQLKTMELQPRMKELQEKYKEKPEQLQKEMVKLYKEEGFNPLGGCLPMLIPWPVLITLFFVFQNTIEFRGVEFLWLPDLSGPDPYYILPVILGLSMFALMYMNVRATGSDNAQQKMLMWVMPVMMTVIFLNFASGLNLYYAASNVASLPQQIQIIGERKRAKARIDAKQSGKKD